MPRWTVMLNVKVGQHEQRPGPDGPIHYTVDTTEYTCGGDCFGDHPERALQEALGKVKGFFEQLMLPKPDKDGGN